MKMRFLVANATPYRRNVLFVALLIFFVSAGVQAQGTHDPQFKKAVPCKQLSAGNYVWGCSRFYSMCANGIESTVNCYNGLVLNPDNNQCEDPHNVWICQHPQPNALYRAKSPFTCRGKKDGNYEADVCSAHYYQCASETRYERQCPVGLIFNLNHQTCDFPNNCNSQEREHVKPINFNSDNNDQQQQQQEQSSHKSKTVPELRRSHFNLRRSGNNKAPGYASPTPAIPEKPVYPVRDAFAIESTSESPYGPVFNYEVPNEQPQIDNFENVDFQTTAPITNEQTYDCSDKKDGIYLSNPTTCVSTFWKCANFWAYEYKCPEGLFYEQQAGLCDYPEYVPACGGQLSTTTTTTTLVPKTNAPAFDCTDKPNGSYELKRCSQFFYVCSSNVGKLLECPLGTVYDGETDSCKHSSECDTTQQSESAPVPRYSQTQIKKSQQPQSNEPNPIKNSTIVVPTTTSTPKPSFNCKNKDDGYYFTKKCTVQFIVCSKEQLSVQQCPDGLLFDPVIAACQHKDVCGKSTTTATVVTTTTTEAPLIVQTTPLPELNCSGLDDGHKAIQPCTATYYTCTAGHAIPISCPPTLVFDVVLNACQYPNLCGTHTKPTDAPVVETTQIQNDQPIPVVNPYNLPAADEPILEIPKIPTVAPTTSTVPSTTPVNYDCTQKQDNYYSKVSCTNIYYSCINGVATEHKCPATLVFDPNTLQCQYASECNKPKLTSTTSIPTKKYSIITTSSTTTLDFPVENYCKNASNGYYFVEPCSNVYYTCVYNTPTFIKCNDGLVFDPDEQACQYVSQCGKSKIVSETPPPSVTFATTSASIKAPTKTFSCVGRKNGYYVKKNCATSFYHCENGVATKTICPKGLVLDKATATCELPQTCYNKNKQPSTTVIAPTTTESVKFDCSNKADGHYAIGQCQNAYIVCAHLSTHVYRCSDNLVFDERIQACEYKDVCQSGAAADEPQNESASLVKVKPISESQYVSALPLPPVKIAGTTTTTAATTTTKSDNCGAIPTGSHAVAPCSQRYILCWNGYLRQAVCFGNQVYNNATGECDTKENVAACNENMEEPTSNSYAMRKLKY